MKKDNIKRIISFILCIITICSIVPITSIHAIYESQLNIAMLNDDQMHEIAEQSTSKLPDELLQKLSLKTI